VARRIFGLDIDNHRMLDVDEIVEAVAEQDVRYKRWRVPLGEQLLGPRGAKHGSVVLRAGGFRKPIYSVASIRATSAADP